MSNKIRVLTNISASQNVNIKGTTVISGSKMLNTDEAFNNITLTTSSEGMYNLDEAVHGLDSGLTTLKNNIKTAYDSIRAVLTGTLDNSGNKKINLTTDVVSGSIYFTTQSLTSVGASVLVDENGTDIYKNDLVFLQLFNSASYLWAEIDAPAAVGDAYRLIVVNHGSLPIGNNIGGGGGGGGNNGGNGGGGGGGGGNLFIIVPITTPTGSVIDSVSGGHEGYYIYPDVSGNVTITVNSFSASNTDGGLGLYVVPNNYTGSISYDTNTDVINSNNIQRIVTLKGTVNNTTYDSPYINNSSGPNISVNGPHTTSSINNNGTTMTITVPVGTGSSIYVDTYSNTSPTTYDFNWSGGVYNNSGSDVAVYVPTFVTGGYWVGGTTIGENKSVITASGGPISLFGGRAAILSPPSTLNGKTFSHYQIKWYGGGDVTVMHAYNYYDAPVNGNFISREPGETGFYFKANGAFDDNTLNYDATNDRYWRFTNFRMLYTVFMSATERQGYSPNYNFSVDPIVYNSGRPLEGWSRIGTYDNQSGVLIVNGNPEKLEIIFVYI